MSWMKKAERPHADPMLAFASGGFAIQVRQAVEWRRTLGCKIDHAFEAAAVCLGTSARRVRGVWPGEVLRIARNLNARVKKVETDNDGRTEAVARAAADVVSQTIEKIGRAHV